MKYCWMKIRGWHYGGVELPDHECFVNVYGIGKVAYKIKETFWEGGNVCSNCCFESDQGKMLAEVHWWKHV